MYRETLVRVPSCVDPINGGAAVETKKPGIFLIGPQTSSALDSCCEFSASQTYPPPSPVLSLAWKNASNSRQVASTVSPCRCLDRRIFFHNFPRPRRKGGRENERGTSLSLVKRIRQRVSDFKIGALVGIGGERGSLPRGTTLAEYPSRVVAHVVWMKLLKLAKNEARDRRGAFDERCS